MTTRRELMAAVGGCLVARMSGPTGPRGNRFIWHRVGRNNWMIEHGGGNTTVLTRPGQVIVVDTKMPSLGGTLAREITERFGRPTAVVLTHHHGDHAGGLHGFSNIPVYAQVKATGRIRSDNEENARRAAADPERAVAGLARSLAQDFGFRDTPALRRELAAYVSSVGSTPIEALLPTATFDGTAAIGDIELVHLGPGHTDNDIFLHDPRADLIAVGDLLFDRHHPFVDVGAGATTIGWQRSLAAIAARMGPKTQVVSGHGRVVGRAGLLAQSDYFDRVRDMVDRERRAGRDRAAVTALPNTRFPGFGFADLWSETVGVVYDELGR